MTSMTLLTEKQYRVLEAIQKYIKENNYSPSLTDIQQLTQIKTKHGVAHYIEQLEKKGYISRTGNYRGIQIAKENIESTRFINIPILGYANCGAPMAIAEEERIGSLQVSHEIIKQKENVFAVIAKGDSMDQKMVNGEEILNNRYVVISKDFNLNDRDAVLAVIDNCATIKSFKRDKDMIILYPESSNPVHQPIYIKDSQDDRSMIQGKVIAVLNNP